MALPASASILCEACELVKHFELRIDQLRCFILVKDNLQQLRHHFEPAISGALCNKLCQAQPPCLLLQP